MIKPLRVAAIHSMAVVSAVASLALLAVAANAQKQDDTPSIEIVASLWCDTPDQLETVLRSHLTDKVPMASALAEINRDSPEACLMARAIVNMGSEVRRVTAGDSVMSLRAAHVLGIMRGQYALMMRPQTWYGVRIVAELTPL